MIQDFLLRELLKSGTKLSDEDFNELERIIEKSPNERLVSEIEIFKKNGIPFENLEKEELLKILCDRYLKESCVIHLSQITGEQLKNLLFGFGLNELYVSLSYEIDLSLKCFNRKIDFSAIQYAADGDVKTEPIVKYFINSLNKKEKSN